MTDPVLLRRDGVALLLDPQPTGLPAVLHWGADPGALTGTDLLAWRDAVGRQTPPATLDAAWQANLLAQETDGWSGRPGAQLTRGGLPLDLDWTVRALDIEPNRAVVHAHASGLELTVEIALSEGGLLGLRHRMTVVAGPDVQVDWLEPTLPVPSRAERFTTFTGRWTREKAPVTGTLPPGAMLRQSRRGRPGHDQPWLLALTADQPRNRSGEVWAVHLGWPADTSYRTDRGPEFPTLLGAGELLRPGEVMLTAGESYTTPTAWFGYSDRGLDGLTARFHRHLRARPQHPRRARPLVLNTWEAVYFDHDPATVLRLADRAAEIGVERFVLDDGWFPARRDDTRGLGDWVVDRTVWSEGLLPLAEHVRGLGMEFGLWVEPEMVNLDSDLARTHPDWLLHDPARVPGPDGLSWRTQWVLDVERAYDYLLEQLSALVTELGIAFLKWDHNRDLVDARHHGRPGVHTQTAAVLRLMAELKRRHPGLEIESCSSGGARSDLGILEVTDRVWASDSNDAVERQDIQRWTGLLLPPELVGSHVGPPTAHSSGRTVDLSYRLATALIGSAGFEWDITACPPEEVDTLRAFGALYRELRTVIQTGEAVHGDLRDPAWRLTGAVLPDQAVYVLATVATLADSRPELIRLPGLDPDRHYRLRIRDEIGRARWTPGTPPWVAAGEVTLPGRMLTEVGVQVPCLWPVQALVLHTVAV
ncbi:alpha-galactosidase [Cellulomonas sp. NPDC089187]|uniref:alpha-galactosidase n=1 Tax=Cellulomonas sp. NPDC089187 TaxID=3154970 RepID=UPI0034472719